MAAQFKISLDQQGDLFVAVCIKGADTLIADATQPRVAESLPAWYRKSVNAPSFLLLPLQVKGKPLAFDLRRHGHTRQHSP